MSKVTFVQDGVLTVAPAHYGMVDSSIGGQLARKMVPQADGRTRRGLVAINSMRAAICDTLKNPTALMGSREVLGVNRLVIG